MLGSGMDSRPWRLALPPGVRWFEVDRADVLAAKQRLLKANGASFTPSEANKAQASSSSCNDPGGAVSNSDQACSTSHDRDVQKHHASGHSLKALDWKCVAADLQKRGWTQKLIEAGLETHKRICWCAEGLLYYLHPDSVVEMLEVGLVWHMPGS